MKTKIFISQPMRGKSNEQILNERNHAVQKILEEVDEQNIEIIDSFFKNNKPDESEKRSRLYSLGESIKLLGEADEAIFLPGCESASGCRIEYKTCLEYGIRIVLMNKNWEFIKTW